MIKVKVLYHNANIKQISISGHAESAKNGEDLVCAGVSCISIGLLNALNELAKDTCELTMNKDIMIIVRENSDLVQNILHTGYYQLTTVKEKYPKNIKIEIQEE